MRGFSLRIDVGFGECDPAGIVYFPRFFDYFHRTMEAWFGSVLGIAYSEVIGERKLGFPAVHTEADFARPTRFGEIIEVGLDVIHLGRSSITFAYEVRTAEERELPPRVRGKTICAVFDLDPTSASYRRAVPLPEDLRLRIMAVHA